MAGTTALVVAAGKGLRLGGPRPKQYMTLAGRPLLHHTLKALLESPAIDAVRPVIAAADRALFDEAAEGLDVLDPVAGGETRQDSVRLGLESLADLGPERVLIHDGARPFVSDAVIARVVAALAERPAAIAALPLVDTLKRQAGETEEIGETVPRTGLWRAQTPQGFHFEAILDAHRRAQRQAGSAELTDDAAVAEQAGMKVGLVLGSPNNIKVTTTEDLARAETLMQRHEYAFPEMRSGTGFDVHRFGNGDHVTICGIAIPHEQGLMGHSDADVGLHALTDALYGALAAGDIGQHFPPSDPQWRGADSAVFLRHARDLARGRGGRIVNVDVTVICERPKLAPHRAAMVSRLSELLEIEPGRISVKATTTEGLGFTGRKEGIAAQATAVVCLPPES
ncbi:MAG: bifunctional 2-C-methyl-D-erythritol 4-phosphate cytidylyltransferase/2-C-methyl-D-erythritol 2,4-cyclodiphosphate synthase [Kiloniellales bacterium]|nr:bifunctional 2-C-methyl-D-erythritol 4-phosphate cytidylyltransferase/2-C-methyl-D-erythritol 2,4-cyclodiphosphate synthase [Kiloniellales bacterium]